MRAAQYQAEHPGTVITCTEGIWRAWQSPGDCTGTLTCGYTEDELIGKLEAAEEPRGA